MRSTSTTRMSRLKSATNTEKHPRSLLENRPLGIALICFFAFIFGFLNGITPIFVVLFVIAPLVVLMIYNPTYAYYIFIASLPLYVVPIKALSASVPRVMGTILFAMWIPYVFFTHKFKLIKWDGFLVVTLIFYGWMLTSAIWSVFPEGAYIVIRTTGQLILSVFIAITLIDRKDKFNHIILIVLLTCMAAGFRSFYMSMFTEERAVGIEGFDQNEFASMLLAPFLIGFSLFNYHKNRWTMVAYLIIMLGCFMGALSTVSRGFILSVTMSLGALLILEPNKKKMLALLLIVVVLASPYFVKRYADRMGSERFELSSTAEVPRGRFGIWLIGWEIYKNHPIAGVGIGGFPVAFDQELKQDPTRISFRRYGRAAHNDYLMIMTELGTIGLLLWFTLCREVFKKGFRTLAILERKKEDYLAAVSRGTIAGLVGLLTAAVFLGLYHSKYMWLLLTLFVLLGNIARQIKSESDDLAIKKLPEP